MANTVDTTPRRFNPNLESHNLTSSIRLQLGTARDASINTVNDIRSSTKKEIVIEAGAAVVLLMLAGAIDAAPAVGILGGLALIDIGMATRSVIQYYGLGRRVDKINQEYTSAVWTHLPQKRRKELIENNPP